MERTIEQPRTRPRLKGEGAPVPGLVLVFSGREPTLAAIPLEDGALELGRGEVGGIPISDAAVSRRHARVAYDGKRWTVGDLGSRNGTFVDGAQVRGEVAADGFRVVRLGASLFLPRADVRPFWSGVVEVRDDLVMGPTLRAAFDQIEQAARLGSVLHVHGESGAGKELAARAFHQHGPRAGGPFVAVNCAAIPEGVAERLLFGAKRGAYSGAAADVDGYVQAAHGGTLFLDEVAELDLGVQAKLLRVLETREVLQLGSSRARPVDLRFCSATHQGLRDLVGKGGFREDLYFRIGRPEVRVPPLRERPEEIPWLVARELARVKDGLSPRPSLIETCLLRRWPGNVRELLTEVRDAARAALAAEVESVEAQHLAPSAGEDFQKASLDPTAGEKVPPPTREAIEEALKREGGNVARTARALGLHRTQLRRFIDRYELDPRALAPAGTTLEEDE